MRPSARWDTAAGTGYKWNMNSCIRAYIDAFYYHLKGVVRDISRSENTVGLFLLQRLVSVCSVTEDGAQLLHT